MKALVTTVLSCLFAAPLGAQYSGGSGTAEDPYQIATAEDLMLLGETPDDYDKHFKLMADIDLGNYQGTDFNIIGSQAFPFSGVFDGNGKKTLNFNYTYTTDNVGLFGYVSGANARIKDLGLIDPNVAADPNFDGSKRVGSLVGSLYNGIVTNCHVENVIIGAGGPSVGGLVGYSSGTIINCTSSTRRIDGGWRVGCLVGENDGGISECNSSGEVWSHRETGGLVGRNSGVIFKCYSSSEVHGDHFDGGLVGRNDGGIISNCYSTGRVWWGSVGGFVGKNSGTISNCYSVGSVSGRGDNEAGLVLENSGTVTASFWDIETSGLVASDGGIGKTTAEMQTASTFIDAGWDFVNVWGIGEGQTYPYLRKYSAADVNQDGVVDWLDFTILADLWMEDDEL